MIHVHDIIIYLLFPHICKKMARLASGVIPSCLLSGIFDRHWVGLGTIKRLIDNPPAVYLP
jgi:hypothetical protein